MIGPTARVVKLAANSLAPRMNCFNHKNGMQISENHLDQIEDILAQSMNGIHLLFDNRTIAKVLRIPTEDNELFAFQNLDRIQDLFSQLVQQESFEEKVEFLHSLDSKGFELLLRTYFHIVENSLYASSSVRH
jgi:hypothetical protein